MNNTEIINTNYLKSLIRETKGEASLNIDAILSKALKLKGLDPREAAALINISSSRDREKLYRTAKQIKDKIYGRRLVLFAPLYVSSYCSNNCLYCGFRADNLKLPRRSLSIQEIKNEVKEILSRGHKRILMLMGENEANCSFDYFLKAVKSVYSVKDDKGNSIRRINVEIPPLSPVQFRRLSETGIGTYTLFQETYHYKSYEKMHPSGPKSSYENRLKAMNRAMENGIDDVGIGALFGLYDCRFEVLGLLEHSRYLEKKYGVGPHTISVPRVEPAPGAPLSSSIPFPVSDGEFKKIVAVLRCAVPYTGIILSTREKPEIREEVIELGVSQISASSSTSPGGYSAPKDINLRTGQFSLNDTRSTGEVIKAVIKKGHIPSFCTGCYRVGRVGEDFMDLARPGLIKLHCLPNALVTLQEYLEDYGDEEVKYAGEELIRNNLKKIPQKTRRIETEKNLEKIKNGERDLFF